MTTELTFDEIHELAKTLDEYDRYDLIELLAVGMSPYLLRDLAEELDEVSQEQCVNEGHKVDNDVCGRPEHRFCRTCGLLESDISIRENPAVPVSEPLSETPGLLTILGLILFMVLMIALCSYC